MSKDTKKQFGFVNISAGSIRDVTNTVIINDYNTTAEAASECSIAALTEFEVHTHKRGDVMMAW